MRGLKDKVALVTGGAGGIGEATVRRLHHEGVNVVIADQDQPLGATLAEELGSGVTFIHGDVAEEANCNAFVETACRAYGGIDLLVNNAAIRHYEALTETTADSWWQLLEVNLMGYVFCAKAALPYMADAGAGAIVNVASIRSLMAGSNTVQYDTSKAAILGLTRATAKDYAAQGIRVNAVGPGPIYTPFHQQKAHALGQSDDEYRQHFGAQTMLMRPADATEVASVIAFLCSDDASYVTGTCIYVDGGLTAAGG